MPLETKTKKFDPNATQKAANTIGDWTEAKLSRFIVTAVSQSPASLPKAIKVRTVQATDTLIVDNELRLSDRAVNYLKQKLGL